MTVVATEERLGIWITGVMMVKPTGDSYTANQRSRYNCTFANLRVLIVKSVQILRVLVQHQVVLVNKGMSNLLGAGQGLLFIRRRLLVLLLRLGYDGSVL